MMPQSKKFIFSWLFLPLGFLVLFTIYPFLRVFIDSFYDMTYTKNYGFVGLDNYVEVLTNPFYNNAMSVSIYYIIAAIIQVLFSLFLAILLTKCTFASFYKAILVIPYMINGIAIGYIFKLFYTRGYTLDSLLSTLGIMSEQIPYWLRDQSINNWALVYASIWRYSGLTLIIFIGAIASIKKIYLRLPIQTVPPIYCSSPTLFGQLLKRYF